MEVHETRPLFVTCFRGLEALLAGELREAGVRDVEERPTGAAGRATARQAARLCLHVRTGLNVLLRLHVCKASSPEELYDEVRALPWEEIVPPGEYLTVTSRVETPSINNSMFPSLKVKDAVCDRLVEVRGTRPDSGPERENLVLFLHWKGDRAQLYLNASGRKLADRGYRKLPHKAPLRENLAAGLLMEAGFTGAQPAVFPMCGSGTLAIEAALAALGRPAGILRENFGFMHWLGYDAERWAEERAEALAKATKRLEAPIVATDHDPQAVEAARRNAATAGVDHLIEFAVCDVAETPLPGEGGIVMLNPEYGKRLGEIRTLEAVYGRVGDFFKQRCAGRRCYLFTGNLELAKKVGLRAARRVPFWNARIECRLLEYEIYEGSRR